MPNRNFRGCLARPISRSATERETKDIRNRRIKALFEHYEILFQENEQGYKDLARALAKEFVPGFHKEPRGRPGSTTISDLDVRAYVAASYFMERNDVGLEDACKAVQRKGWGDLGNYSPKTLANRYRSAERLIEDQATAGGLAQAWINVRPPRKGRKSRSSNDNQSRNTSTK